MAPVEEPEERPETSSVDGDDDEIFGSIVLMFIEFCVGQGMDRDELFRVARLDSQAVQGDPEALVEYESLMRLWTEAMRQLDGRPLGLLYATHLASIRMAALKAMGVIGYAVSNCRDIRQAIELMFRYSTIIDPRYSVNMERSDDQVRVVIDHDPRVVAMQEPLEYMVGSLVTTMLVEDDRAPSPIEVSFRHARRHPLEAYTEVLGPSVRFEAQWYGVSFEAAVLDLPVVGADPQLGRYLQQQAEAMLEARGGSPTEPLDARVRHAIDQGLLAGDFDQSTVAQKLGMSVRTLQRSLGALDTSFSAQVDAVRRGRALQLIKRPGLSVAEVAFMLGYGDPRTFYRNFRRWTGRNPTAYRQEQSPRH